MPDLAAPASGPAVPLTDAERAAIRANFEESIACGASMASVGSRPAGALYDTAGDRLSELAAEAVCAPRAPVIGPLPEQAREQARRESEAQAAAEAQTSVEVTPGPGLDWSGCNLHLGIDVGSTTVKLAVLDMGASDPSDNAAPEIPQLIYAKLPAPPHRRPRHAPATCSERRCDRAAATAQIDLRHHRFGRPAAVPVARPGVCPGGHRQQDVPSSTPHSPATDVAIELGGEDAKIIYFDNGIEQRMNGTCAGGTGAFIDQMASSAAHRRRRPQRTRRADATTIYPIASRCGVFAKTDVQPLLNEGARPEPTWLPPSFRRW